MNNLEQAQNERISENRTELTNQNDHEQVARNTTNDNLNNNNHHFLSRLSPKFIIIMIAILILKRLFTLFY